MSVPGYLASISNELVRKDDPEGGPCTNILITGLPVAKQS